MADAAKLRITLLNLDPAPWREVEVPLDMSFKGLHDTIQAAFLWLDQHLWEFEVKGRRYGVPLDDGFGDEPVYRAASTRLTKLRDEKVGAFVYVYDMGDSWEHRIEVLDLTDSGDRLPRLIAGQWRAPPEDVGGPPGFAVFLEALADPDHPDHDELTDWYGGPFDPDDMDEETIQAQLKRIANARRN